MSVHIENPTGRSLDLVQDEFIGLVTQDPTKTPIRGTFSTAGDVLAGKLMLFGHKGAFGTLTLYGTAAPASTRMVGSFAVMTGAGGVGDLAHWSNGTLCTTVDCNAVDKTQIFATVLDDAAELVPVAGSLFELDVSSPPVDSYLMAVRSL